MAAAGGAGAVASAVAAAKESLVKFDAPTVFQGKGRHPKAKMPVLDGKTPLPPRQEILNAIIPPREYSHDGLLWVQYASSTPATKMDVRTLQEQLDLKLQQRQARETGICPIREELYAQCFDELIRQVTIDCSERGILLLRVRDEIRMTVAAYQSLYESSIAFGMRKALMAEQRKSELQAKVKLLAAEVAELEKTVLTLESRCADLQSAEQARVAAEEEKHAAELARLRASNDGLRESIEALLAPPNLALLSSN